MSEMKGPILDNNPPLGDTWEETAIKWKFTNKVGEPICDLRITVHGPWYSILPDIKKVTVTNAAGAIVADQTADHVHEVHLDISPCIPVGEDFSVSVRFDSSFDLGEAVQFAPTTATKEHIVAEISPVSSAYLASANAIIPPPVWDVATVAGALPIPWTTPITIASLPRYAAWLAAGLSRLARLLAMHHAQPGSSEQPGLGLGPEEAIALLEEGGVRAVVEKLRASLGRDPTKTEVREMMGGFA